MLIPMELAHLNISNPTEKELELIYIAYFEVEVMFAELEQSLNGYLNSDDPNKVIPFKVFVDLFTNYKAMSKEINARRKQMRTRMMAASSSKRPQHKNPVSKRGGHT